jgi:hypothetical protein
MRQSRMSTLMLLGDMQVILVVVSSLVAARPFDCSPLPTGRDVW